MKVKLFVNVQQRNMSAGLAVILVLLHGAVVLDSFALLKCYDCASKPGGFCDHPLDKKQARVANCTASQTICFASIFTRTTAGVQISNVVAQR